MIVVVGGWYVADSFRIRNQAWEGTILEVWDEKNWSRILRLDTTSRNRSRTRYYWKVTLQDGSPLDVRVTTDLGRRGKPGDRVVKRRGERYPRLASDVRGF